MATSSPNADRKITEYFIRSTNGTPLPSKRAYSAFGWYRFAIVKTRHSSHSTMSQNADGSRFLTKQLAQSGVCSGAEK
jgi:hypothetical protein